MHVRASRTACGDLTIVDPGARNGVFRNFVRIPSRTPTVFQPDDVLVISGGISVPVGKRRRFRPNFAFVQRRIVDPSCPLHGGKQMMRE